MIPSEAELRIQHGGARDLGRVRRGALLPHRIETEFPTFRSVFQGHLCVRMIPARLVR